MKKLLTAVGFLALINPVSAAELPAADTNFPQQEFEQNINEMSQEIITNMQKASRTMQQAIPVFSQHFKEIMRVFNQEMIPVMQAMDDNMRLIAADQDMALSLQNSLPRPYNASSSYNINPKLNELSVSGSISENDNSLRYNITRNLAATTVTQSFISKINTAEEAKIHNQPLPALEFSETIVNLDNRKLPADKFKLEEINNLAFLVYEDDSRQESFIFGNLTPELNLRLQASGPDYKKTARKFINALNPRQLQKAVTAAAQK